MTDLTALHGKTISEAWAEFRAGSQITILRFTDGTTLTIEPADDGAGFSWLDLS